MPVASIVEMAFRQSILFMPAIISAFAITRKRPCVLSMHHNSDMNTFADRIKEQRSRLGLSQAELAKRIGTAQSTIGSIENGRNQGSTKIGELAAALGVDALWLETGKGHPRAITGAKPAHTGIGVPVLDIDASMGVGKAQPENDTIVGSLRLNPIWVRQQLPAISSPDNLAVLTAYGDSMEPTFRDGDMLLVDRGVLDVKLDAVYVLAFNRELFVKRIQRRMNGDVVIKSDNPLYDPHVVANGERETLQVLGRVVWAWNGRKL